MPLRLFALALGSTIVGLGIGLAVGTPSVGLVSGFGAGLLVAAASTLIRQRT